MTDSYHFQIEPEPRVEMSRYLACVNDYFTRAAEQANRLVFPSGAAVLTSGDKIVGRVEAQFVVTSGGGYSSKIPCGVTVTVVGAGGGSAPEPKRAPLDWNTTTRHDTFGPDFIVTKGAAEVTPTPSPTTQGAYPAIAGLLRG